MVHSMSFARKILMIGVFCVPSNASLFFKSTEAPASWKTEVPPPTPRGPEALRLEAIYQHHDQNYWIVWINGQRIDSRQPQSIAGWYVKEVLPNKVVMRSVGGAQECVLFLGQELPPLSKGSSSTDKEDEPISEVKEASPLSKEEDAAFEAPEGEASETPEEETP